jgi:hypothetical protein
VVKPATLTNSITTSSAALESEPPTHRPIGAALGSTLPSRDGHYLFHLLTCARSQPTPPILPHRLKCTPLVVFERMCTNSTNSFESIALGRCKYWALPSCSRRQSHHNVAPTISAPSVAHVKVVHRYYILNLFVLSSTCALVCLSAKSHTQSSVMVPSCSSVTVIACVERPSTSRLSPCSITTNCSSGIPCASNSARNRCGGSMIGSSVLTARVRECVCECVHEPVICGYLLLVESAHTEQTFPNACQSRCELEVRCES